MTVPYLKRLARAFYKIGLGVVYLDLGEETAYSARFDEVRKIILGEQDFTGYLAMAKKPPIEQVATVKHWDQTIEGTRISLFRFYYYGVDIFYDIEHRSLKLPPEADEVFNFLRF